jgi:hypothetical protein
VVALLQQRLRATVSDDGWLAVASHSGGAAATATKSDRQ